MKDRPWTKTNRTISFSTTHGPFCRYSGSRDIGYETSLEIGFRERKERIWTNGGRRWIPWRGLRTEGGVLSRRFCLWLEIHTEMNQGTCCVGKDRDTHRLRPPLLTVRRLKARISQEAIGTVFILAEGICSIFESVVRPLWWGGLSHWQKQIRWMGSDIMASKDSSKRPARVLGDGYPPCRQVSSRPASSLRECRYEICG